MGRVPQDDLQTVYVDQAHQWAEVAFDELGWVTFEPTAPAGAPGRTPGFEDALDDAAETAGDAAASAVLEEIAADNPDLARAIEQQLGRCRSGMVRPWATNCRDFWKGIRPATPRTRRKPCLRLALRLPRWRTEAYWSTALLDHGVFQGPPHGKPESFHPYPCSKSPAGSALGICARRPVSSTRTEYGAKSIRCNCHTGRGTGCRSWWNGIVLIGTCPSFPGLQGQRPASWLGPSRDTARCWALTGLRFRLTRRRAASPPAASPCRCARTRL